MDHFDDHHQIGIYFTITSFASSVAAFIISSVTKTNAAWYVGIIAGLISIYCGYLTQKEKKMSIKRMEREEFEYMERKKSRNERSTERRN